MLQVFIPLIGVRQIRAFKGQGQECAAARVKSLAARGSGFSNELRSTRSTLKQVFSSRNISIFAW
jgi:hypothetical protein